MLLQLFNVNKKKKMVNAKQFQVTAIVSPAILDTVKVVHISVWRQT